jgi:hypothetical protein
MQLMPKVVARNTEFPRYGNGALRRCEILLDGIWRQCEDDPSDNSATLANALVNGILGCEACDMEDVKVQLRVLEGLKEHESWRFEVHESIEELSKCEQRIADQALVLIRCYVLDIDSLPIRFHERARAQCTARIVVDNTAAKNAA